MPWKGEYITPDDLPAWLEACRVGSVHQHVQHLPEWYPENELTKAGYIVLENPKSLQELLKDGIEYAIYKRPEQVWVLWPESEGGDE